MKGNCLKWNGETLSYSILFDLVDPDGEKQTDSEGYIAAHFFDDTQGDAIQSHVHWIVNFVYRTFFPENYECPLSNIIMMYRSLEDYITEEYLRYSPINEEEAAQIGRDTLLITLRYMAPEFVNIHPVK